MFVTSNKSRRVYVFALSLAILLFSSGLYAVHRRREQFHPARRPRAAAGPILSASGQFMTLDSNGKFLINSITQKPVFIVGEAAWSLMTQLSDSDVEVYLSDRASRGFNYIWCGAADNYYQANPPKNYYGDSPFDAADFTSENPRYWSHVDRVIQRAAAYGITVALSPAFVGLASPGGYLKSYQNSSADVLVAYGAFLGDRYKSAPNLIWVLGGDVDPGTGVVPKITALANGIRSKDSVHLFVAEGEPQFAASDTFAGVAWMNLDWLYFHTSNVPAGAYINYADSPGLPAFLGEGWYENEHDISALQLREQWYWAILGGANVGNGGFGNRPLWFFGAGPDAETGEPTWQSQLNSPGSIAQMNLGKLFRSREHWKLVPDAAHTIMTDGYDSRGFFSSTRESVRSVVYHLPYRLGDASSEAARTDDGQTVIAYVPNGNATTIMIDMSKISDSALQAKCWWFNPRDGSSVSIGTFTTVGARKFTPPDGNDWVLVLDSASANLPAPGSKDL
jgi:Protein of unknown function (DUF4038)/Putative collagen-binding domain of a collagenase